MNDRLMIPFRWLAAWCFYWLGCTVHRVGILLIAVSQRSQGIYGFRHWPWREDDLWGDNDKEEGHD